MNILFFLKPKSEVAYIHDYHTLCQALEIMEYHRYSSVPILNKEGKYLKVDRRLDYQCVTAKSKMEDLIGRAMEQNFVPVIDDEGHFIGIITRRDIIEYCYNKMKGCADCNDR